MTDRFILDGLNVVPAKDLLTWVNWYVKENRTFRENQIGDTRIITVFHGVDIRLRELKPDLPPLLFQTIIYGRKHGGYQRRTSSAAEAIAQHERAVELVTLDHLQDLATKEAPVAP